MCTGLGSSAALLALERRTISKGSRALPSAAKKSLTNDASGLQLIGGVHRSDRGPSRYRSLQQLVSIELRERVGEQLIYLRGVKRKGEWIVESALHLPTRGGR